MVRLKEGRLLNAFIAAGEKTIVKRLETHTSSSRVSSSSSSPSSASFPSDDTDAKDIRGSNMVEECAEEEEPEEEDEDVE